MRFASLLLLALLSGCADISPSSGPSGGQDTSAVAHDSGSPSESPVSQAGPGHSEDARDTPPSLYWTGGASLGVEAGRPWDVCRGPLNSCDARSFSLDDSFDLDATLAWGSQANDLDLYLFRESDGQRVLVSDDGVNADGDLPTTEQVLRHPDLPAGEYRLYVAVRHGVLETYELEAHFA